MTHPTALRLLAQSRRTADHLRLTLERMRRPAPDECYLPPESLSVAERPLYNHMLRTGQPLIARMVREMCEEDDERERVGAERLARAIVEGGSDV